MNVKKIFIICEDKGCFDKCKHCEFMRLSEIPKLRAEKILGIPLPWFEATINITCFRSENELATIYEKISEIRGDKEK